MSTAADHDGWRPIAHLSDFAASDAIAVQVDAEGVALFLVGDSVYATSNRCSHGEGLLCDGWFEGTEIECPLHQGRFDVRTGLPTAEPAEIPLPIWPARIDEHGRVLILLS